MLKTNFMRSFYIYFFRTYCLILTVFYSFNLAIAQPNLNSNLPCYSVATTSVGTSILYELNPITSKWGLINQINRSNIKALAIAGNTNTLFAIDKNELGTINPITAEFKKVGPIGSGNGPIGTILLNDIYGLTYVADEDVLYATHRIFSYDPQTNTAIANSNDILFKINPSTGRVILGAFYGDDYTEIDEIANSTISVPTLYDVTDIAYDSSTGELLVLHGYQLPLNDIITANSLQDGTTETFKTLLFKPSLGLTFDAFFNVFVSTVPEPNYNNYSGDIYKVNVASSGASRIDTFDPSLTTSTYFSCLDCIKNSIGISNCQPVMYLNNYSPIRSNYNAQLDIFSNNQISSTTTYNAGNSITLSNNFSVPTNTNFSAVIGSCN